MEVTLHTVLIIPRKPINNKSTKMINLWTPKTYIYIELGDNKSQRSESIKIGDDYQLDREKKDYSPRKNYYGGCMGSLFKPRRGERYVYVSKIGD